jgi:hypothetical protein
MHAMNFPHLPLSSPLVVRGDNGQLRNNEPWQRSMLALSQFAVSAHTPATATSSDGQTLTYVRNGALVSYTYTGTGGVSFTVSGTVIDIPTSTTSQTTASHIIVG